MLLLYKKYLLQYIFRIIKNIKAYIIYKTFPQPFSKMSNDKKPEESPLAVSEKEFEDFKKEVEYRFFYRKNLRIRKL